MRLWEPVGIVCIGSNPVGTLLREWVCLYTHERSIQSCRSRGQEQGQEGMGLAESAVCVSSECFMRALDMNGRCKQC